MTVAAAAIYADFESYCVNFNAVKNADICAAVCDSGLTMCSNAARISSSLKLSASVVSFLNIGLKVSGVSASIVKVDKEEGRS